jgi:hypothetical protein
MPEKILSPKNERETTEIKDKIFVIIHSSDDSMKQINALVNSIIKHFGLVEQGFLLLPE